MAAGGMIDEGGMVLPPVDPLEAARHAAAGLDASGYPLQRHAVAEPDGNRQQAVTDERGHRRGHRHRHRMAARLHEEGLAEERSLNGSGGHICWAGESGSDHAGLPRGDGPPFDQTTDAVVIGGGDETACRSKAVEDPRFDGVVGRGRAVHVEMGQAQVRDRDRVAGDARQTVSREHVARHFHHRMRAAILAKPPQPVGEHLRAGKIGRHRLGVIGSQAAEIGKHSHPQSRLGEDRRREPGRGRLAAGAGDGNHLQSPARITGKGVRHAGHRPTALRHDAQRRAESRDDAFRNHSGHASGQGPFHVVVAVSLGGEPGHEHIPRPAGVGIIGAARRNDVVAGEKGGIGQHLRQFDAATSCLDATGSPRTRSVALPVVIAEPIVTHAGLLPGATTTVHGARSRGLVKTVPRSSLNVIAANCPWGPRWVKVGFLPPKTRPRSLPSLPAWQPARDDREDGHASTPSPDRQLFGRDRSPASALDRLCRWSGTRHGPRRARSTRRRDRR